MRRSTASLVRLAGTLAPLAGTLVLLAGAIAVSPAAAQPRGFEFHGLTLGMDQQSFITTVAANGWAVPSYTRADGHLFSRAIEYQGIPQIDSLVDEVLVETEGLKLACPEAGAPTCVAVESIRATFRFGRLHSIVLSSERGQEKVFRPYALASLAEIDARLGRGDKSEEDIAMFFRAYNIDKAKTFDEIPIATWRSTTTAANATLPITARVYAVRLTEKYDMFREESGVFTPWGACRLVVALDEPDVDAQWAALKAEMKGRAER